MSATVLESGIARRAAPASQRIVLASLLLLAMLGVLLLAISLVPSSTLVGRFMGALGDSRSGTVTQALVERLPQRLRLAGIGFVFFAIALLVARKPFERIVHESLSDLRRGWHWRLRLSLDGWVLGGLLVLATAVRLVFISQPMRYDEALTFNEFASRPLYYGLSFYPEPNNHLLNTLLMHVAYVGLGNQPWVLRLPALVAGVLLVLATYALGRVLYDRAVGLGATALVAASSYLVEYSTNARGYTLAALCFVVVLCLLIVAVRRDSLSALLLAAVVGAFGFYAVPTMLYGLALGAAWLAIALARASTQRLTPATAVVGALLVGLGVSLLYLPVVLISGPEALLVNRFVVPLGATELLDQLPVSLARTGQLWNRDLPLVAALLLAAGCVVASVLDARRGQVPLAGLALAVCGVLVLAQRVAPFERVWMFLLPLYLVVACAGLLTLVRRFVPAGGSALRVAVPLVLAAGVTLLTVTSGAIPASPETGVFADAQSVASTLRGRLGPGEAVLTQLPASLPELQYYFPKAGLGIDSLVRNPSAAEHVYVAVAPNDQPRVAGWTQPVELARYRTAVLYELTRRE
jgi:hypothetical protein